MLPSPVDPIADELPPLPAPVDELVDELVVELEPEVTGELPRVVTEPKRLVAAVKADEAFGAEVATEELELFEELDAEELELALDAEVERSRPWSLRLPTRRGVISVA